MDSPSPMIRVLVIGTSGSGKTTLIHQLCHPTRTNVAEAGIAKQLSSFFSTTSSTTTTSTSVVPPHFPSTIGCHTGVLYHTPSFGPKKKQPYSSVTATNSTTYISSNNNNNKYNDDEDNDGNDANAGDSSSSDEDVVVQFIEISGNPQHKDARDVFFAGIDGVLVVLDAYTEVDASEAQSILDDLAIYAKRREEKFRKAGINSSSNIAHHHSSHTTNKAGGGDDGGMRQRPNKAMNNGDLGAPQRTGGGSTLSSNSSSNDLHHAVARRMQDLPILVIANKADLAVLGNNNVLMQSVFGGFGSMLGGNAGKGSSNDLDGNGNIDGGPLSSRGKRGMQSQKGWTTTTTDGIASFFDTVSRKVSTGVNSTLRMVGGGDNGSSSSSSGGSTSAAFAQASSSASSSSASIASNINNISPLAIPCPAGTVTRTKLRARIPTDTTTYSYICGCRVRRPKPFVVALTAPMIWTSLTEPSAPFPRDMIDHFLDEIIFLKFPQQQQQQQQQSQH